MELEKVTIYTDGGCALNPGGNGAYGVVILFADGTIKELSGGYEITTNNRMEIMAAIKALQALDKPYEILIYTDSQYLINTASGVWRQKKNLDLFEILNPLLKMHKITWKWVKGHNGDKYNEKCDELATCAMSSNNLEKDLTMEDIAKLKEQKVEMVPKASIKNEDNILNIDGKRYRIVLEEIKPEKD